MTMRCLWHGHGAHGACTGEACKHHLSNEVGCALDAVGAFPEGMAHRRVAALLDVNHVQVLRDETRALAKLWAWGAGHPIGNARD